MWYCIAYYLFLHIKYIFVSRLSDFFLPLHCLSFDLRILITHLVYSIYFHCPKWQKDKTIATGLGLWCLTPLSPIFHLYHDGQFYWWRKPEKITNLPQVTWQALSHNVVSSLSGIRTNNFNGNRHWLHKYILCTL